MTGAATHAVLSLSGSRIEAQANSPLIIDDPESAWLVEAGSLDVFIMQRQDGEPAGPRRHLLRALPGQAVFGFETGDVLSDPRILAIGSPGTRLLRIDLERLQAPDASGEPNATATFLLDTWVAALSCAVAPERTPKGFTLLQAGRSVKLARGSNAICERDVLWVRHLKGSSHFLGSEALPPVNGETFFPLMSKTWVSAPNDSVLECVDTSGFQQVDFRWTGLRFFHGVVLAALALRYAESDRRERQRLQNKQASERSQMRSAMVRLAGALSDGKEQIFVPGDRGADPLLTACQMAGASIGLEIRGPVRRSETAMEDPLREIARASGIRTRKVMLAGQWWRDDHGAMLGYVQEGKRPVALIPGRRGYELHDPVDGSSKRVNAGISLDLEPFGYTFYRPLPNRLLTPRDLLDFGLKNCRGEIKTVILTGVAGGLLGLVTPIFTGMVFDTVIPGAQRWELLQLTALLLVGAIATGLFDMTRTLALLRLEGKMGSALQAALWDRLLNLPVSFFRRFSAGDLADRANGIDAIRSALTGTVANSIISGIFSLFNYALMLYYSWKLALVALGLVLIAVFVTWFIGRAQLRVMRDLTGLMGRLSGKVLQFFGGISKLRISGTEGRAFWVWSKGYATQRTLTQRARSLSNGFSIFNSAYMVVGSMAIFYSIKEWAAPISPGDYLAFNAAFGQMFVASMTMAGAVLQVMSLVPLLERANPILQTSPEVDAAQADPGELTGQIEVDHVSFRYEQDKPPVLRDVSFRVEAGQFVALVGPSGCGKSTLFRLLLRFDQPEAGAVHYDGKDLRDIDVLSVRRQMGVVLQNSFPFRGDIFANIVGSKPLTLEDAWEAARMAGLDEDIRQMPMGMHTVISETGGLSGGQRQRLMIARAIVSKPRILLFDEATSALDNRTQATVSHSLEGLKSTRIVIAHRLSTVINADRIIVMDQGRVVQSGTYNELLQQEGLFAELARRQLT